MNAEDRRRLEDMDRRRDAAVDALANGGGWVVQTVRVGRDGHICRRESELSVRSFPLDQRAPTG